MLKKTITFTDYNGSERTEDFYFNLTKAELVELESSIHGGYLEAMARIISAQDNPTIMQEFKRLILRAYGEKSSDGRRFVKSEELSKAFSETEAYSELFMEFFQNPDKAVAFFTGIIPVDLRKSYAAVDSNQQAPVPAT